MVTSNTAHLAPVHLFVASRATGTSSFICSITSGSQSLCLSSSSSSFLLSDCSLLSVASTSSRCSWTTEKSINDTFYRGTRHYAWHKTIVCKFEIDCKHKPRTKITDSELDQNKHPLCCAWVKNTPPTLSFASFRKFGREMGRVVLWLFPNMEWACNPTIRSFWNLGNFTLTLTNTANANQKCNPINVTLIDNQKQQCICQSNLNLIWNYFHSAIVTSGMWIRSATMALNHPTWGKPRKKFSFNPDLNKLTVVAVLAFAESLIQTAVPIIDSRKISKAYNQKKMSIVAD